MIVIPSGKKMSIDHAPFQQETQPSRIENDIFSYHEIILSSTLVFFSSMESVSQQRNLGNLN